MADSLEPQAIIPDGTAPEAEAGSLLEDILAESGPAPEGFFSEPLEPGLKALLKGLLAMDPDGRADERRAIDGLVAELDHRVGGQLDEILHHSDFQALESAWRGLKYLVDQTDFRENIGLEIISIDKDDLLEDFEESLEVTRSGLYKQVYTTEYGQFGGKPFAAVIANYALGPGPRDIRLMQNMAAAATMAHSPVIASASPEFFAGEDYLNLPNLVDLKSHFEAPRFSRWRSFRESEDARSVGLTLPRILLRLPYDRENHPISEFGYEEDVRGDVGHYLWGSAVFAFASRLTDSFARYRWCPNIIGPQGGGTVEGLPVQDFESLRGIDTKIPTDVLISERREFELSEEGFISLTMRTGTKEACFFSANSVQKPKRFGQDRTDREAEFNYRLGTQLPYLFIITRLAHYLKVMQREEIGTWKERIDLERELNNWIRQYIADMDVPTPGVRGRRPLRQAKITVSEVEGSPGIYRVNAMIRPHFKYMGAFFSLDLVARLDKE
ncbi:MAG: type VI secretion system contractile sheath large subunit [Proteobacteria bacterium]|nr:type VI secretion system contractile sheath large subunit [Pseudomonadota bacterium]